MALAGIAPGGVSGLRSGVSIAFMYRPSRKHCIGMPKASNWMLAVAKSYTGISRMVLQPAIRV